MALTKAQFAKAVKKIVFPLMPKNANAILVTHCYRKDKLQEHFRELFEEGSSEIILDTDRNSLQWRILKYLKKKSWISDPEADLKRAWESAKKANAQQGRNAFLGGYGKEKAPTKDLRVLFSQAEQTLCSEAVTNGTFSPPCTIRDFLDLIEKAFVGGQGTELIEFLARLWLNHKEAGGHDKMNANILILSLMWVSPIVPFWLLPSRAIADFIRVVLEDDIAQPEKTINSAIRVAGLVRIFRPASSNFYKAAADPERKRLFEDMSNALDFDISKCLAGRPRGS